MNFNDIFIDSSQTNEFLRECSSAEVVTNESRGRSRLSERERRQAALAILVFGNDLVCIIFVKPNNNYCSVIYSVLYIDN